MKYWKSGRVRLAEDALFEAIKGRKIAMMVNGTAVHNDGRMLMDIIALEKRADVEFFLGMEHGVRCNFIAGKKDEVGIDEKTGIPIVDLYKYPGCVPPADELKKVDAVVYCTQDSGVRHWTFTPWLMLLLDSAAEAGCEVIIVDRPNPIGGNIVEGGTVEEKYQNTLLTGFGYPLRHGMTVGELALMYRAEKKLDVEITVLKAEGWTRDMFYTDTGLMWLPTTVNTPTPDSFLHFCTTGLLQSTNICLGHFSGIPFRFVGRPEFDSEELAAELNSRGLDDVFFAPKFLSTATAFKRDEKLECSGIMTVIADERNYRAVRAQLHIMDALVKLYSDRIEFEYEKYWARKRMGTDDIYTIIENRASVLGIAEKWEKQASEFRERREEYLLYR